MDLFELFFYAVSNVALRVFNLLIIQSDNSSLKKSKNCLYWTVFEVELSCLKCDATSSCYNMEQISNSIALLNHSGVRACALPCKCIHVFSFEKLYYSLLYIHTCCYSTHYIVTFMLHFWGYGRIASDVFCPFITAFV